MLIDDVGLQIERHWLIQADEETTLYLCEKNGWWFYVVENKHYSPGVVSQTGYRYDNQRDAIADKQTKIDFWMN